MYLLEKQKPASSLLVRTYYSLKGFYFESYCILLRNFTRCFIHGIFLLSYSSQILSLVVVDMIFLLVTLLFIRQFLNNILAMLFVIYQALILTIDIFFLTHNRFPFLYNEQEYDLILFIVLSVTFATSILVSLALLVVSICELKKKHVHS